MLASRERLASSRVTPVFYPLPIPMNIVFMIESKDSRCSFRGLR